MTSYSTLHDRISLGNIVNIPQEKTVVVSGLLTLKMTEIWKNTLRLCISLPPSTGINLFRWDRTLLW